MIDTYYILENLYILEKKFIKITFSQKKSSTNNINLPFLWILWSLNEEFKVTWFNIWFKVIINPAC